MAALHTGYDADIVIAGAGCAGLSLAVHLAERAPGRRGPSVLLLDPRTAYGDDRTWCGFRTRPHPFEGCVSHRWNRFRVSLQGRVARCRSDQHPYEHIPGIRFYERAQQTLDADSRNRLQLGTTVTGLDERQDHVRIHTDHGELRAPIVVDTRPPAAVPGASRDIRLAQHFVGWVIETDRPHFDPGEATLMDFIPDSSGVHFRYILPFGPRRALVEDTWFSPEPWPRHVYEALLAAELERSLEGDEYRVVHTEAGIIPMTTTHLAPHPSPRRYRLGLAGGAAKPSSGYAFGFIQRDAASLAGRLAHFSADSTPPPLPAGRPVRAQALDNLFLSYLAEHPESAPEMFFQLFARADTDSLARFLSETSSPRDDLAIIWALPPWPMIAHLLRRPSRFRPRPSAA